MTRKNVFLLVALIVTTQLSAVAQSVSGWNWKDSSKVAVKNLPQYNEFLNNAFPYPAKPRDQWELGFGLGISSLMADVNPSGGFAANISLRKAIDHIFSVRGSFSSISVAGTPSNYGLNIGQLAYKNQTLGLGADVIATLNAKSYYRSNPKTNVYLLGGYTLLASQVKYKNGNDYTVFYGQRAGQVNTQDGLLTTFGGTAVNGRKEWSLLHGLNLGGGIAFKLSDKVNLAVEQKYIFTAAGYDYLDAFKGDNSNDFYSATTVRLNLNIGNKDKHVQPLNWINPNDYVYNELNAPKHMKLPKQKAVDSDKDGVIDELDMEPNTPKGAPVDTHGVSKDTDGDGIPDFKDKELLTPQKCFPVNNEGIGNCPDPACCKELKDAMANLKPATDACAISELPGVQFRTGAVLSKDAQSNLATAATILKANPNCNVKVIGYGSTSKAAQQQSWDRVNAVIRYLSEKQGISESRLIFVYAQDGDAKSVSLQPTAETGSSTVPAPHPNLMK